MRTVLYTEDLQPIAIVELTASEEEIITHGGVLRFASIHPTKILINPAYPGIQIPPMPYDTKIYGDLLYKDGIKCTILFIKGPIPPPQEAKILQELWP